MSFVRCAPPRRGVACRESGPGGTGPPRRTIAGAGMVARITLISLVSLLAVTPPAAASQARAARDTVVHLRTGPLDALPQDESERAPDDVVSLPPRALARPPGPAAARATSTGPNVRMNSLLGSPPGNCEAEVSIAANGLRLISA